MLPVQEYVYAVVIGIIQGLTEFLPVSSSGHLVLSQHLLGLQMPGLTFEVFLHFGTLISVFWVFRERVGKIIASFWVLFTDREWEKFLASPDRRFGLLLLVGTVPAAVVGLLFRDFFEAAFATPRLVGFMLLVTGGLLWLADWLGGGNKDIQRARGWDALVIGTFQALAIMPGISRSGATITGALFRRLDKKTAAEYSFLLSIPAIAGATALELVAVLRGGEMAADWLFYGLGITAAALAGILAIRVFLRLLVTNRLKIFAIYCWLVALLAIILI